METGGESKLPNALPYWAQTAPSQQTSRSFSGDRAAQTKGSQTPSTLHLEEMTPGHPPVNKPHSWGFQTASQCERLTREQPSQTIRHLREAFSTEDKTPKQKLAP